MQISSLLHFILNSITTDGNCNNALSNGINVIQSTLGDSVGQLLDVLATKVNSNGIVVYTLYAKFFNDQADAPCTNNENWVYPGNAGSNSLLLTTDRRSKFNALLDAANRVLKQAVTDAPGRHSGFNVVYADWDPWVTVINGHFCEPGSSPNPADPSNENLQFFKLDTTKRYVPGERRRGLGGDEVVDVYSNISLAEEASDFGNMFETTPVLSPLEGRDPPSSRCPTNPFGWLAGDAIGKIFHPNQVGHVTIASYVTDAIRTARAKILGLPNPDCEEVTLSKCYSRGSVPLAHAYATAYALYGNTQDFCNSAAAQVPPNMANWKFSKTYNQTTPDENTFYVTLQNDATGFSYDACLAAVNSILDGCDGNDPTNNPMNWKTGGEYQTNGYLYQIIVTRTNRPWPRPKEPSGQCIATWYVSHDAWDYKGAGWASWDWGQQTILPNLTHCIGSTPSNWQFEYFDEPDEQGFEWHSWGGMPVFQKNCLSPVMDGSGGPSGVGCGGCCCC